ncbi:hypothetical protein HLPR_22950 [Helicovermis profundi]|uniref:Uncharacterized protein n=1 Tax=Helicovermis profundi TaxID=3065157 RepID=A0AAU9E5N7_9FIRM|nr:hypothetical protein HLPR_22950 [Clostridia bacterium S502]
MASNKSSISFDLSFELYVFKLFPPYKAQLTTSIIFNEERFVKKIAYNFINEYYKLNNTILNKKI